MRKLLIASLLVITLLLFFSQEVQAGCDLEDLTGYGGWSHSCGSDSDCEPRCSVSCEWRPWGETCLVMNRTGKCKTGPSGGLNCEYYVGTCTSEGEARAQCSAGGGFDEPPPRCADTPLEFYAYGKSVTNLIRNASFENVGAYPGNYLEDDSSGRCVNRSGSPSRRTCYYPRYWGADKYTVAQNYCPYSNDGPPRNSCGPKEGSWQIGSGCGDEQSYVQDHWECQQRDERYGWDASQTISGLNYGSRYLLLVRSRGKAQGYSGGTCTGEGWVEFQLRSGSRNSGWRGGRADDWWRGDVFEFTANSTRATIELRSQRRTCSGWAPAGQADWLELIELCDTPGQCVHGTPDGVVWAVSVDNGSRSEMQLSNDGGSTWGMISSSSNNSIINSRWAPYSSLFYWGLNLANPPAEVKIRFWNQRDEQQVIVECEGAEVPIPPPQVVSVSPSNQWSGKPEFHGDRNPQIFTTVFSNPGGWNDIDEVQFGIADSPWWMRYRFWAKYKVQEQRLYLYNLYAWWSGAWGSGVSVPVGSCLGSDMDSWNVTLKAGGTCVSASGSNLTVNFSVRFKDNFYQRNYDQYLFIKDIDGNQDETTPTVRGWGNDYYHDLGNWGVDLTKPYVSLDCKSRSDPGKLEVSVNDATSGATDLWYKWINKPEPPASVDKFVLFVGFPYMEHVDNLGGTTHEVRELTGDDAWGRWFFWGAEDRAGNDNFWDKLGWVDNVADDSTRDRIKCGGPWWQVTGGDVHADSGAIESIIPIPTCKAVYPDCIPLLILDDEGSNCSTGYPFGPPAAPGCPGICEYAGSIDLGLRIGWENYISTEGWRVPNDGGVLSEVPTIKTKADYAFYHKKLNPTKNWGGTGTLSTGFYNLISGNISSALNIGSGTKVVVLRNGNVTVKNKIRVDPGGFFALIASEKITFDDNLTETHGVYIADEINFGSGFKQFKGEGTFVGWSSVTNRRDFGLSDDVDVQKWNNTKPVVSLKFRPDFVLNVPSELKIALYPRWEEVLPEFKTVATPAPTPTPGPSPSPTPPPFSGTITTGGSYWYQYGSCPSPEKGDSCSDPAWVGTCYWQRYSTWCRRYNRCTCK